MAFSCCFPKTYRAEIKWEEYALLLGMDRCLLVYLARLMPLQHLKTYTRNDSAQSLERMCPAQFCFGILTLNLQKLRLEEHESLLPPIFLFGILEKQCRSHDYLSTPLLMSKSWLPTRLSGLHFGLIVHLLLLSQNEKAKENTPDKKVTLPLNSKPLGSQK